MIVSEASDSRPRIFIYTGPRLKDKKQIHKKVHLLVSPFNEKDTKEEMIQVWSCLEIPLLCKVKCYGEKYRCKQNSTAHQ